MYEDASDATTLYRRHYLMVRNRAASILNDDALAEDVAQEVFLKFIKTGNRYGADDNIPGILYVMSTRLSLNRLRSRKNHALLQEESVGAGRQAEHLESDLDLQSLLQRIPLEDQVIARYYFAEGMSQEEIAEVMEVSRRTVSYRLQKLGERLRQLVKTRRVRKEASVG
jgi:RNA polymerase sigma-70 factor (ECF subfamily)